MFRPTLRDEGDGHGENSGHQEPQSDDDPASEPVGQRRPQHDGWNLHHTVHCHVYEWVVTVKRRGSHMFIRLKKKKERERDSRMKPRVEIREEEERLNKPR